MFIRDLSVQLREEQKNLAGTKGKNILYLYRGEHMSTAGIEILNEIEVNSIISVVVFLSTSRNENIAISFMKLEEVNSDLVPLLYEIKCYLILDTKPFADVSAAKLGAFSNEEEVLFMVGTIFQFKGIFYD